MNSEQPFIASMTRWFKNGDHPLDQTKIINGPDGPFRSEGKLVRRYRIPGQKDQICSGCKKDLNDHCWVDGNPGLKICPGNWVIIGSDGSFFTENPDEFADFILNQN